MKKFIEIIENYDPGEKNIYERASWPTNGAYIVKSQPDYIFVITSTQVYGIYGSIPFVSQELSVERFLAMTLYENIARDVIQGKI